ncbi:MAG: metalloregulator ArsR/SmtB family transcription factor [Halioglobus sp.]
MHINPLLLYKCLADSTRLQAILLIHLESELCVCELTAALQVSQPKVSRHLAQLRECGLLVDRREGQWVFYRLNPELPAWAAQIVALTADANSDFIAKAGGLLAAMGDRPGRKSVCC